MIGGKGGFPLSCIDLFWYSSRKVQFKAGQLAIVLQFYSRVHGRPRRLQKIEKKEKSERATGFGNAGSPVTLEVALHGISFGIGTRLRISTS